MAQIDNNHHRRRPGEDPIDWTVRTAELKQHENKYWYIHFTELRAHEARKYRTAVVSTRTRDKTEAWHELKIWGQDHIKDMRAMAGGQAAPPMLTFREAAERYLIETAPRRLTTTQDAALRRICLNLGDELLPAVDHARIAAFHAWTERQGYAKGTARRFLDVIMVVLRHAAATGLLGQAPRYRLPSAPAPRVRALGAEESTRVFDAAAAWSDRRTGLFVCLALDTGQRKAAILGLTWDRVDLRPGRESINFVDPHYQPDNKRRCGALPMTARLARVMAAAKATAPTGPVFPIRWIDQGFTAFREAVGLPWFTPHVARHTWATLALARGVPLATVAYILADSIATIDRTYNHHTNAMARENLERYNQPASTPTPTRQDKEIPHGMAAE